MNKTTVWSSPNLPEIEFFSARYTNFSYKPHFHEDYAIGVVENGVHAFNYRGEKYLIPAGRVVTCQPGEVHNGYPGNDDLWCYRMLYIRPSLVQQIAEDLGYPSSTLPFLNETYIEHQQVISAVRLLHQSALDNVPTLSQEVLAHQMLRLVLGSFSDIRPNSRPITDEKRPLNRTIDYMHAHYTDDIQLDELANIAYLSKSYYIRAFRKHTGLSPYAYLLQIRLNHAKALLQQGVLVTDVAQQTGFYDQSHLTRYFKRFLGLPPGQYMHSIG